ncbi:hypothetical protein QVD17_04133 [Tagetes erecta]|uniref:Dolichol phosphate-mannose biosynthesis regulatory protein n=1 Tax=Tagetes erecta TaxID=13708 RepID=A0AAD8LG38_TARER|nr:hypothetical protein QVD17_04133 [Tagetes erecta]
MFCLHYLELELCETIYSYVFTDLLIGFLVEYAYLVKYSLQRSEHQGSVCVHTMELADRAIGFVLASISVIIFTYYTFWVIILPFVDKEHFVHNYFLPQEYAILLPVYAGVSLICFLSVFIGYVMLKSKKKKA